MAAVLTLLLIASLLQGALCQVFMLSAPRTLEVLNGSCVNIPCSFDIPYANLHSTCGALWKQYDNDKVVFDSRNPQAATLSGELTGHMTRKDCTTILNNMQPVHSKVYYFRLECNEGLKYNFKQDNKIIDISVKAAPPRPTLTPSTLKVKEGTSVNFTCSAPAPCLSHPPALTWTPGLGEGQESLRENQDKTKVKLSVLTFTASHLHHGKNISCTATYSKLDGSTESAVSNVTADISFSPKDTTVLVRPSGPVPEGRDVTLTCSSTANPPVRSYIWFRADGGQETFLGSGPVLRMNAVNDGRSFFCKTQNDIGAGQSNNVKLHVKYSPQNTTASVRPSGPVPEGRHVTLTCSSTANPPVRNYTWFRADGGQETLIGTRQVVNIKVSKDHSFLFCTAENNDGTGKSNVILIDVLFAPQILPSSNCTKAASQISCSCTTVGNPSPTLLWYLDGLPVNQSDKFLISTLNDTGLRSILTVNQPQDMDLSNLLCLSSNSQGSASQSYCITNLNPQGSEQQLGPYSGALLAVAVVSLSINILLTTGMVFLWRARRNTRPKEQDQIYMSLDGRDQSPEYEVIARTPR